MSDILIYHPETQAVTPVPFESVWHYRQAGWVLYSEWEENEAARLKAEARSEKQASATPSAGGDREKK